MFSRTARRRSGQRPARRRGVAAVTLLAMIVCQLPAPVPLPAAALDGKDRSELYPCRDRPCGCASASACWTGCCCFTNAQKIAWAKANGVTLPAFVHAAARREATPEPPSQTSCCKRPPRQPAPAATCCSEHASESTCAAGNVDPDDAPPAPWGWMAQKCRGEIAACGALPWALRPVLYAMLPAPHVHWERPRSVGVEPHHAEPPTPPPRLVHAAPFY